MDEHQSGAVRRPLTDVLTHGFLGRKEDELDRSELDAQLNALGADGWEFEKLLIRMALHGEKDGHLLIFQARTRVAPRAPCRLAWASAWIA